MFQVRTFFCIYYTLNNKRSFKIKKTTTVDLSFLKLSRFCPITQRFLTVYERFPTVLGFLELQMVENGHGTDRNCERFLERIGEPFTRYGYVHLSKSKQHLYYLLIKKLYLRSTVITFT